MRTVNVAAMTKPPAYSLLLAIVSGMLLAIPFLYPSFYFLTWLAFIPFIHALTVATSIRQTYAIGLIFGLTFCAMGGYWIVDFIVLSKGLDVFSSCLLALLFWLVSAQLFAFLACTVQWFTGRNCVSNLVSFPIIVVTAFSAFPSLFPLNPGSSQSQFIIALQPIDLVGTYGLDGIIALANIVVYRFLQLSFRRANTKKTILLQHSTEPECIHSATAPPHSPYGLTYAVALLSLWFTYGLLSNHHWENKMLQWQTIAIGIVQPNENPSLEFPPVHLGFSRAYPPEMAMTERLVAAGAKLVIWPEARYKGYFDHESVRTSFQNQVRNLNASLLFQDIERYRSPGSNKVNFQFNSAAFISPDEQAQDQYRKMRLIPFGEYLPLAKAFPKINEWNRGIFGAFTSNMTPGTEHKVFNTGLLPVIPLICYETMFPTFVANAVPDNAAGSVLVGLSSDGWFGKTLQPFQHTKASILRAIENRLPFIHVLNNGPSIVALPNGRVIFQTNAWESGGYLVDLPHSTASGGSLFSRYPNTFIYSVWPILLLMFMWSLRGNTRVKRPDALNH